MVACDDRYAPSQYFSFFEIERVKVFVVPTEDGTSSAPHVLDRLLRFDLDSDDERWMLLDTDHCIKGSHLGSYTEALQRARQAGVKVALSNPCFELWLLLHHVEPQDVAMLKQASKVEEELKRVLGGYNKTMLKKENFPIETVPVACERARELDTDGNGGDVPLTVTTRVYKLLEALASAVSFLQVPEALRTIRGTGERASGLLDIKTETQATEG
ncbi:RloB family protein [Ralstonia flaminis]|uniref:RloB family protein n=1 Tax=Ralstonia flaminis TaxID=3058597 RepID=UPI00292F4A16|nr:RloB family protein [Ralstonia sp. LMG 18101]